jgi:uncharacterized Zn finger protein (UPF0148 family)
MNTVVRDRTPVNPHCHDCGEPLECFEGEWYCPSCTAWTIDPDGQRWTIAPEDGAASAA